MKNIINVTLLVFCLLISACGSASETTTVSDVYKTSVKNKITAKYPNQSFSIYEYNTIENGLVQVTYYFGTGTQTDTYSSINSNESKSIYEIKPTLESLVNPISGKEAYYVEFAIAYTTNNLEAEVENRFENNELKEIFTRANVKVDNNVTYKVKKIDIITDEGSINNIALKRNGRVISLYLNGNSVKTFTLDQDITRAYLLSYKYYEAKIKESYTI